MRKVISDFIDRVHTANQSEQTVTLSLHKESDKIIQIYSDERYSLSDLAAILEDDVSILLRELKSESAAIESDRGNEYWESVHDSKIFLISGVVTLLIDRAAGVRVFLSDDFLRQHEDDKFLNIHFAEYVRNEYKGKSEPQQKPIAAPQQPRNGSGGVLAGSDNDTQPEGNKQTVIKKEDLPTIYDDEVNKAREQYVFYNAIKNKLMVLNDDGKGYTWKTNGKLLGLMCAILYWNDEIEKKDVRIDALNTNFVYTLKKNNVYFEDAARLKEMFGGKDISNYRTKLHRKGKLPEDWEKIDRLF